MKKTKLQQVIEYYGTATKMAETLKISPAAITQWRGKIPPLRAYEIEEKTNGKFTKEWLLS